MEDAAGVYLANPFTYIQRLLQGMQSADQVLSEHCVCQQLGCGNIILGHANLGDTCRAYP